MKRNNTTTRTATTLVFNVTKLRFAGVHDQPTLEVRMVDRNPA